MSSESLYAPIASQIAKSANSRMASTSSLVVEPCFDHVVSEHIAAQQERVIAFERGKRLIQRYGRRALSWSRLSAQILRVDKWSVCRG